jgi:uracil-DNA glycosylase family 4
VPGVGDVRAEWLFVGEAPGAEEDARGEPFVGQAGKLLDNMLAALGMKRGQNVYIANVLKCRPPNNRAPEPREVDACRPYLDRQIALIRPKVIVALGKSAATTLLDMDANDCEPARARPPLRRRSARRHVPSCVPAAELARQAKGVGRTFCSPGARCARRMAPPR